MYIIISLKHTFRRDKYITLWNPNNAGYCYSIERAGVYENPEIGYHDSPQNTPVLKSELEKLSIFAQYDRGGEFTHLVPNCPAVWNVLGFEMTKNGLRKSIKQ